MAQRKGISTGTTAQRSIEEAGKLRFNTSTSLLEYYDGTGWKFGSTTLTRTDYNGGSRFTSSTYAGLVIDTFQSDPNLSWDGSRSDWSLLKLNRTIFFCCFQSLQSLYINWNKLRPQWSRFKLK